MELEFEFDHATLNSNVREVEELNARVATAVAFETEAALRKRSTLWPQRTGFSRDRFRAEDDHAGDILIFNTAPYAAAVNNLSHYPRGGANPNFRSAQRTVQKFWNRISQRALNKATS